MKKIEMLIGCVVLIFSMQASQEVIDREGCPSIVVVRERQVTALLAKPNGKALLFAIEQGCDNHFVAKLLDSVVKKSSDRMVTAMIIKRAEKLFREKSPHVLELQNRINSGATPAQDRARLERKLRVLQTTGQLPDGSSLK